MELWDILDESRNETGSVVERGKSMNSGQYHLVVFAIIVNSKGEFIISKRAPNKTYSNKWEFTGGSVLAGEDSLSAVLREVKEELGIELINSNGKLLKTIKVEEDSYFGDVWLFEQDVDINDVVCQEEEVTEARIATKKEVIKLIDEDRFIRNIFITNCLELIY